MFSRSEQQAKMDKSLAVEFHWGVEEDVEASRTEGRKICRQVEFVKIIAPADKTVVIDRRAEDEDRFRFRDRYEAFKNGLAQEAVSGTPLSALALTVPPVLDLADVEMYKFYNVHTAEQLVTMADGLAMKFMGHQERKRKIQAFIDASKENAPRLALQATVEALRDENAELKRTLKEYNERFDKLEKKQAKAG